MEGCIFCKITAGQISSHTVYQDERVLAFRDINPQAPVHILIIPKTHITSLAEATDKDESLLGHILLVASQIARSEGIAEKGYRVGISTRREGGQTVEHLHLHLLGGRQMGGRIG